MKIKNNDKGCAHPSVYLEKEMAARGWDRWELARRMGGDYRHRRLEIDLYFEVGPTAPNLRIGDANVEAFAHAFGVNPDFFRNLEEIWLRANSDTEVRL